MKKKNLNPFDLKTKEESPKDYLDTDKFSEFLKKKKIIVRKDNLPRFANRHNIKLAKKKREGSAGTTPTIYKIPTKAQLEIMTLLFLWNQSLCMVIKEWFQKKNILFQLERQI